MNRVKVKAIENKSCRGFEGFHKQYPVGLTNVMSPEEFGQVINRINTLSATKYPKTFLIPVGVMLLGMLLFIIGIFDFTTTLISMGFTLTAGGMVGMVIMFCLFRKRVRSNIQPSLVEANNYFSEKRITFNLREKQGKPKVVKQVNGQDKVQRKNKMYLEITFPAPGSSGGILGFVQNILPSGLLSNNNNNNNNNHNVGYSNGNFQYQPNQMNVGGVAFQPPPMNVMPQMNSNSGRPEFVLSSNVAPNFNISIDAVDALSATAKIAKAGAEVGYNTFI